MIVSEHDEIIRMYQERVKELETMNNFLAKGLESMLAYSTKLLELNKGVSYASKEDSESSKESN